VISAPGKEVSVIFNQYTANVNEKIQLPAAPQVFPGRKATAPAAPHAKRAAALLKPGSSQCALANSVIASPAAAKCKPLEDQFGK